MVRLAGVKDKLEYYPRIGDKYDSAAFLTRRRRWQEHPHGWSLLVGTALKRHLRSQGQQAMGDPCKGTLEEDGWHQCNQCDRSYATIKALRTHQRWAHQASDWTAHYVHTTICPCAKCSSGEQADCADISSRATCDVPCMFSSRENHLRRR